MSAGDQAALAACVGLAGAVGVGAVVTSFLRVERGNHLSDCGVWEEVFEGFLIVAVLVCASVSAYDSVAYLHADRPLGSGELHRIAIPLVAAVCVLTLLSVIARLPSSMGAFLRVGIALAISGLALTRGSSVVNIRGTDIISFTGGLFVVAAVLAFAADRLVRWQTKSPAATKTILREVWALQDGGRGSRTERCHVPGGVIRR